MIVGGQASLGYFMGEGWRYAWFGIRVVILLLFSLSYIVYSMKEEKRRSMLTLLLAPTSSSHLPSTDKKENYVSQDLSKLNNQLQQSSACRKFMRVVKRIGTKQTITSFHTEVTQPKSTTNSTDSRQPQIPLHSKPDKQNIQPKQIRKKLKRVGKKVWVTAYKHNINQLQPTSQFIKQQTTNQNQLGKYQYNQFKEQTSDLHDHYDLDRPAKNAKDFGQQHHGKHGDGDTGQDTKNGRYSVNQMLDKKQFNRISAPDLKKPKPQQTPKNPQTEQQQQQISQTNNIPLIDEQSSQNFPQNKVQFHFQQPVPEIDIDKMLEQIQSDQAVNRSIHKSSSSDYVPKRRTSRNGNIPNDTRKSSRFYNKGEAEKKVGGRDSTFKPDENRPRDNNLKNSATKPTKRQSKLQQSVSLHQKNLKRPLPPAYPFSHQKQKSILNSQTDVGQLHSKQKVPPILSKQSSIHSTQSQMTVSKVQMQRIQLRQLRKESPLKENIEAHGSLHYSQKKEIGTRKIGIQKFRNAEIAEQNKITSSLKKNKNLEMNWYIAEAKRQVITDNLFRQTGYRN